MKVIILGISGGIGEQLLGKFLAENHFVIGTYNKSFNRRKFKNISNLNSYKLNLRSESQIKKFIKFSLKKYNHIDVIINSTGDFFYDDIQNLSLKRLKECFNLNVFSNILINKYLAKLKKNKKKTIIVNLGSSSAEQPFKNTISYCSSKTALVSAIQCINLQKFNNIFNTVINFGSVKTKMGKKVKGQNYNKFFKPSDIAEFVYKNISSNIMAEKYSIKRFS